MGVYRETIRKSDNAFRQAQDQLGILLANHLVSAVDALISSRLSSVVHRPTTWRTALGRTDRRLQPLDGVLAHCAAGSFDTAGRQS